MEKWENYKFYRSVKEIRRSGNYKMKIREVRWVQNRIQKKLKDSKKQQKTQRNRTGSNVGNESNSHKAKRQEDVEWLKEKGRRCKRRMDKYKQRIQREIKESKITENKNKTEEKLSGEQKLTRKIYQSHG